MPTSKPWTTNFLLLEPPNTVKYALLALLELAKSSDQTPITLKDIAAKQLIPESDLGNILLSLWQSGLVQSYQGVNGGYVLNCQPWQITLLDVVISVENQPLTKIFQSDSPERVVIHRLWQDAENAVWKSLQRQTLDDLSKNWV